MATLNSDEATLEIKLKGFKGEWLDYGISFHWRDEPMVNDAILKREGEWWSSRETAEFLANDYEKSELIEILRRVLKSGRSDYWEPLEPDIIMAVYPRKVFPFLESKWTELYRREGIEEEDLLHNLYTVIAFIDTYNFEGCKAYSSSGLALHLLVEREELEKFLDELEEEYKEIMRSQEG